jgi:hypothetical protein
MRQAYFWPIYGEEGEIVFHYAPSRAHSHVEAFLGAFRGTLLSDGYEAYAAYARHHAGVTQAGCWSHCRRRFERAQDSDPGASAEALALIGALYRHEKIIRDQGLEGARKLAYRTHHSAPVVEAFWDWCDEQCHRPDLLPSSPLAKALKYAMARHASCRSSCPTRPCRSTPIIWNRVRYTPNSIIQTLQVTCRLQGVDLCT